MVADHLKQPCSFVCLEDSPFPGWWAKISLFEPGRFSGRVLYLDLDVTVSGNLDDLADYPAPFVIVRDWGRLGFNSSIMAWTAGYGDPLHTKFDPSVMDQMHGDQDWIFRQMPSLAVFPRRWCVSYKRAKLLNKWPDDMRVCVFHGRPKPWDLTDAA